MTKPFLLGLTGSIGMGKSTTAAMFEDLGIPVWDADKTVHKLYDTGGAAVGPVSALAPASLRDGKINRKLLANWLAQEPEGYAKLEAIVHPLVAADRRAFVENAKCPIVVLDIPLLFETNVEDTLDAVAVVSTSKANQRERVLQRPEMTADRFEVLLDRQLPDAEKRKRASYIIDTSTLETARTAVESILDDIGKSLNA